MGRISGNYPIYLPRDAEFTEKLVQRIHCETLHGGIGFTMAAVRERYWVPRLRSLVKLVRKKCWGCKRFQQRAFTTPVAGQLPDDRTNPGTAFEVIGVDFAGPVKFRKSNKAEAKAYLCIFACSLSRAIHLELFAQSGDKYFYHVLETVYRPSRTPTSGVFRQWWRVHQS